MDRTDVRHEITRRRAGGFARAEESTPHTSELWRVTWGAGSPAPPPPACPSSRRFARRASSGHQLAMMPCRGLLKGRRTTERTFTSKSAPMLDAPKEKAGECRPFFPFREQRNLDRVPSPPSEDQASDAGEQEGHGARFRDDRDYFYVQVFNLHI